MRNSVTGYVVEELGVVDQSSQPIVTIGPTASVPAPASPRPGTSSFSAFAVEDFQENSSKFSKFVVYLFTCAKLSFVFKVLSLSHLFCGG
jgi:hypothetical protein